MGAVRWGRLAVLAVVVLLGTRHVTGDSLGFGELEETWRGNVEQLSWRPRAFALRHFLSDEECNHLIAIAQPRMLKSTVLDSSTGVPKDSEVRTSTSTFFGRGHDPVLAAIERRVAAVTMIPIEHQEGLQVLHYTDGQKYDPHYDYFLDDVNTRLESGGQRIITLLMYLTTPEQGGETVFPDGDAGNSSSNSSSSSSTGAGGALTSSCAARGLVHRPVRGDALMFYSLSPDGKKDPHSLHGSCPTLKGDKWSATKWIHVAPFRVASDGTHSPDATPDGDCVDTSPHCTAWAVAGECRSNAQYMLSACRASCGGCAAGHAAMADAATAPFAAA